MDLATRLNRLSGWSRVWLLFFLVNIAASSVFVFSTPHYMAKKFYGADAVEQAVIWREGAKRWFFYLSFADSWPVVETSEDGATSTLVDNAYQSTLSGYSYIQIGRSMLLGALLPGLLVLASKAFIWVNAGFRQQAT